MRADHLTAARVRDFVDAIDTSQPRRPPLPTWVDRSVLDASAALLTDDLIGTLTSELRLDERSEAEGLYAMACDLGEQDKPAEGIQMMRRAVEAFRALADAAPVHELAVATCLHDLSIDLADTGNLGESVEAAKESVELLRKMAHRVPSRFEPALGKALGNLALVFGACDLRSDALRTSEEAALVLRRVAGADATYEPVLADALNNWALELCDNVETYSGAIGLLDEAVEMITRWAEVDPANQHAARVIARNRGRVLAAQARHRHPDAHELAHQGPATEPDYLAELASELLRTRRCRLGITTTVDSHLGQRGGGSRRR